MRKSKENAMQELSMEDHLIQALRKTDNDKVRYYLRETLQIVYAQQEN